MIDLFKTRKCKTEQQTLLVGAYMPEEFVSALVLHCLSKKINKSCALQEIFQDWYRRSYRVNEETILNEIIYIIQHEWDLKKRIEKINDENKNEQFNRFLDEITDFLSSKKVITSKINEIKSNVKI